MITAARRWLRRNRTSFAVGFGVVGVGYIAGQYVLSKIVEARDRTTSDRIAKENLRRRFQQNQEDCTITVLELLPTVTGNVLEALQSERISQDLQQKKVERLGRSAATSEIAPSELSSETPSATDEDGRSLSGESYIHASQATASSSTGEDAKLSKTKVQLWNDLKITSITRAFTLLYTVSLLSLLTRIQLNLLGRRNYVSSVVSQASYAPQSSTINLENHDDGNSDRAYGSDFETNRKYLTFSWWLLHRGWREIMLQVETAVKEVFGPLKPTEHLGLKKLSGLILDVRKRVEGSSVEERSARKWLAYLLPPQDKEELVLRESGVCTSPTPSSTIRNSFAIPSPPASASTPNPTFSPPLRRLLDETADLIDSPMFTHVLTLLLDATFSQLTDQKVRSEAYRLPPLRVDAAARIQDVTDNDPATTSAKLAIILAVLTREAHKIGGSVPNEYVQALEGVSDLEAFAAVIYSSNFELEASASSLASSRANESHEAPVPEPEGSSTRSPYAGLVDQAAGVMDTAWGGFESVWGKFSGSTNAVNSGRNRVV